MDRVKKSDIKRLLKRKQIKGELFSDLPKSTFVFVTYNRCPYKDFTKNPLTWAFQTLINNKGYSVDEFIVVDDCSSDHTHDNINWLKDKYSINIKYHRLQNHKELSYCRRYGVELSSNNLIFMGDDDCLFSEFFLLGSVLSFQRLMKEEDKLAVLNLNVFEKNTYHLYKTPIDNIGVVNNEIPYFCHNFEYFPKEYLEDKCLKFIFDDSFELLRPFEIDTFKGVNLCRKDYLIDSGNYLDLSMWKYGYSEHIELSRLIKEKGYKMFHQPDPDIYAIHLKYGGESKDVYDRRCWSKKVLGTSFTLKQLVEFSSKKRIGSGTRSSSRDFHFVELGSFLSFYLKINIKTGLKFLEYSFEEFVVKGVIFSTTPNKKFDKSVRIEIWTEAMEAGVGATELQTDYDLSFVRDRILRLVESVE